MSPLVVYSDEFEWVENWLRHIPTGARFKLRYPDSESEELTGNWAGALDMRADGKYYERDEILRMAYVLLTQNRQRA